MNDVRLRILTVGAALVVLLFVLELVRRRRLKEEYSVLWIVIAILLLVFAVWFDLLNQVTHLIGAAAPTSTLFFFGLLFVVLVLLHFSVRISELERRFTALVQEMALMALESKGPQPAQDEVPEPLDAPDRITIP